MAVPSFGEHDRPHAVSSIASIPAPAGRETKRAPMVNILVVDDHPAIRRGIKEILAQEPDVGEWGEAQDCREAKVLLHAGEWHLLILDISLPDRNGLELLRDVRRECPDLPILVVSMYPAEQCAERALQAGANGYLSKESAPRDLVTAVRTVLGGKRYGGGSRKRRHRPNTGRRSP